MDEKEQRLQELEAELKELRTLLCDRLETVEGAIAETSKTARQHIAAVEIEIAETSKTARRARLGSKYNYRMLVVFGLLIVAIALGFLPEKWQEAASPDKVSKNLIGLGKVVTDFANVVQAVAAVSAGAIAWKAKDLKDD